MRRATAGCAVVALARDLPSTELPARHDARGVVRAEDVQESAVGARQIARGREGVSGGGAWSSVGVTEWCRVGVDVR
jgi:hypothetical protein